MNSAAIVGCPGAGCGVSVRHLIAEFGVPRSPVPLYQFVPKVHSRCGLACDHCYVFESADQSWRGHPIGDASHRFQQAWMRRLGAVIRTERATVAGSP